MHLKREKYRERRFKVIMPIMNELKLGTNYNNCNWCNCFKFKMFVNPKWSFFIIAKLDNAIVAYLRSRIYICRVRLSVSAVEMYSN